MAESKHTPVPWGDCKVSFGVDSPEIIWESFIGPNGQSRGLPPGWTLCETDASGARCVAIFRIDGVPSIQEGEAARAAIAKAEGRADG